MGGSMTKILPGLFVGGLENAKNEEELIANCISHILLIQAAKGELEKQSPSRQYLQAIISERGSCCLLRRIPEVNTFIHGARAESGNVLVCSESGISTNVAVVAAYLMTVYSLDRRSAVSAVQGLRHFSLPVPSLVSQLDQFDATTGVPTTPHGGNGEASSQVPESPAPTGSPSLLVTAKLERRRLKDMFGDWPGYEEDLQCLLRAINSFKSLSESGFILRESSSQPPSRSASPASMEVSVSMTGSQTPATTNLDHTLQSSHHLPTDTLLPGGEISPDIVPTTGRSFIKFTPPRTPPSTPTVAVGDEVGGGVRLFTSQHTPTSANSLAVSLKGISEAGDCSPPATLNENELFPDSAPLLDVDQFAARYCHQLAAQCRTVLPNSQSPPLQFEVGVEMTSDVEVNDEEDDDIPGAITILSSLSSRQSRPRTVAASYHTGVLHHLRNGGNLAQVQSHMMTVPHTSVCHPYSNNLSTPSTAGADRLSTTVPAIRSFLPF